MQFRQGDVLIESVKKLPSGKHEAVESGVVAFGEVTGHAHRLQGKFELMRFVDDGSLGFRVLGGGAVLRHEEHGEIAIPKGTYRVRQQREYTPEAIRTVAD